MSNIAAVEGQIELFKGDLADVEMLDAALPGVDVIFHEGAIASVPQSVDDPLRTHHVNLTGTLRVLEGARRHGVRRVVFAASSAAAVGSPNSPRLAAKAITNAMTNANVMRFFMMAFRRSSVKLSGLHQNIRSRKYHPRLILVKI